MASTLLGVVADAFDQADLGLGEGARKYVSSEFETVDDIVAAGGGECSGEQLIVQVTRQFTGLPGGTPGLVSDFCTAPQTGEFIIRYTKCVPVIEDDGSPPAGEAIDDSSEDTLKRMWLTTRAILAAARGEEFGDCSKLVIIDAVPVGTGGAGGFAMTVHGSLS